MYTLNNFKVPKASDIILMKHRKIKLTWQTWRSVHMDIITTAQVILTMRLENSIHCHGGKTEETNVTENMEKCQHGNFHDKERAVYDETGKKIHGPGGDAENLKSATQTKNTENMEKCKHGNFHDEDGTVYDEAGNKIHGPGGEHGGEGEWGRDLRRRLHGLLPRNAQPTRCQFCQTDDRYRFKWTQVSCRFRR